MEKGLDSVWRFIRNTSVWLKNPAVVDEHFVPTLGLELEPYIQRGNTTGVHHLIRYQWTLDMLSNLKSVRTLLDIACGSGYGSFMIAGNFPAIRVTGADYDHAVVERAQKTYRLPNLSFHYGDAASWDETIGPMVFDCITCFDTIEHIAARELAMENLVNHLSEDGYVFFSTPCGWSSNNLNPKWQYHKLASVIG